MLVTRRSDTNGNRMRDPKPAFRYEAQDCGAVLSLRGIRRANGSGRHQTAPRKLSSVANSGGLRLLTGLCENP